MRSKSAVGSPGKASDAAGHGLSDGFACLSDIFEWLKRFANHGITAA
jgi:hypothetical protein